MAARDKTVVDLYQRHARAYDRDRGRSLEERTWLDRFLDGIPPDGTVLDVGCGMGEPIARQGRRFAGVVAWDSFFHLGMDDQRAMFDRFAAHALPSAPLLFTSGSAAGESIGSYRGEPLYHASLDPAEYRTLLAASGFSVESFVADDPDCGGHTVWLARYGADPC